ncbi:MAG: amidohydrolase [Desulfobacteraceae bacterium]|nr:MAG: amidohydrolase [Desulfobacteraceae bacterium]
MGWTPERPSLAFPRRSVGTIVECFPLVLTKKEGLQMIIDFSSHIILREAEEKLSSRKDFLLIKKNFETETSDPEKRIAQMKKYGIDMQVLTQSTPVLEGLDAADAADICRISNDAIGAICRSYPERFIPFAVVTLQDVGAAVKELERAVGEWDCRGVTIGTNSENLGLDNPRFYPFYEAVERHDIPLFLHPMIWHSYELVEEDPAVMRLFGWPFDTTQAILRLVLSGTMERFERLTIVTHHLGGGMFPFYSNRFNVKFSNLKKNLKKPVEQSFSRIYGDTAVDGTAAALPCGHAFFGTERMLFGTDYPFSPEQGELYLRENLRIVKEMNLPQEEKDKILGGNAKRLLKL